MSHFSLKTLRWTGSFPGEFAPEMNPFHDPGCNDNKAVLSLKGRPWAPHADASYAYDTVSKKMVTTGTNAVWGNGTFIYDPVKRDFSDRLAQPFVGTNAGSPNLLCPTPHGIVCYQTHVWGKTEVGTFLLDVAARKWEKLGPGSPQHNRTGGQLRMVYDSKRDRLVLLDGAKNSMSEFGFTDKTWKPMPFVGEFPKSPNSFGSVRESAYLPKHDRIICYGEWTCDLANGNKWESTGIRTPCKLTWDTGLAYDPGLDVLVLVHGRQLGRTRLSVMRYEPKPGGGAK